MGMIDFISDNAVMADPKEREASLREKVPDCLMDDEHVVLAYKDRGGKGRDSSNFTTHRILIKDKQGLTGKKTEYISVPYDAIKAYSVETAGKLDSDSELKVYVSGLGRITMDFSTDVDIFALNDHLNRCVLEGKHGAGYEAKAEASGVKVKEGGFNIFDIMGSNASQIDAGEVESSLKSIGGILLDSETVEMAFKVGRDSFVLTSHRILDIDVQGMTGSKVEYFTILWSTIRAFAIETAGSFLDRDAELTLFTSLPDRESSIEGMARKDRTRIGVDFRKGQADIYAVQKFFADKLLGPDTADAAESAIAMEGEVDGGSGSVFAWMGDDSRMVDAAAMDRQYHASPPILQACERVEMAFKGRRDLMLFTSKRLVFVDMKGFSAFKKAEYTSIPWSSVQCYGVKSAGSFLDKDSELMIWTDFDDCFFPQRQNEDDPQPPPIPRMSYLECDFQKDKVDILAVQRYLSERILRVDGGKMVDGVWVPNHLPYDVPVSDDIINPSTPGALSNFVNWLGDNAKAVDPAEVDANMHGDDPILQADEKVVLAYQSGRDFFVMTTKRVFIIDKKGFTGKRVAYISVPYTSIRAFAVESAGSFDSDAEVKLWTKTYWSVEGGIGNKIDQDLKKGADIVAIQNYLATQIIGAADGASVLDEEHTAEKAGKVDTFLSFLGNDGVALDKAKVEEQLKTSPPMLQEDESVDAVYKMGRDMAVFTTKRVLAIDRQGITGKKIEYLTFPLRYIKCFRIRTAGHMMSSSEVEIFSDGSKSLDQDLAKSSSDVWTVQKILANKTLKLA